MAGKWIYETSPRQPPRSPRGFRTGSRWSRESRRKLVACLILCGCVKKTREKNLDNFCFLYTFSSRGFEGHLLMSSSDVPCAVTHLRTRLSQNASSFQPSSPLSRFPSSQVGRVDDVRRRDPFLLRASQDAHGEVQTTPQGRHGRTERRRRAYARATSSEEEPRR